MNTTKYYFDYAAATPLDPKVKLAMEPYLSHVFYNPSATYQAAREVKSQLEAVRGIVAHICSIRSSGVHFTAGVTEANNMFLLGLASMHPGSHFLLSAVEHESIIEPVSLAKKLFNCEFDIVPVDNDGRVDPEAIAGCVKDNTVAVSVMLVNNEIGVVQPVEAIAAQLNGIRKQRTGSLPLLFHSDAAQAPLHLPIAFDRLGVDALSLSGAKMYGPKQTGALLVKPGVTLAPWIVGGGQEKGLRGGTENVAGSIAFAAALQQAELLRGSEVKRLNELRQVLEAWVVTNIPEVIINGAGASRAPHISSLTFPDLDGERAVMELDERGFMVATGSACTAADEQPSHVIQALGRTPHQAAGTLRISFGRETTEEMIKELSQNLLEFTGR